MPTPRPKDSPTTPLPTGWAGRIAWGALLACAAALPLTTSVTRRLIGGTWSFTEDFVQVPKLLSLLVLAGVATAGWAVDLALTGRRVRLSKAHIALAVFAVLIGASTAFASQPVMSWFGSSELMTGAVTWLTCLWLCFLVGQYVTSGDRIRHMAWAFAGGATGVGLIGLLQAVGADPLGMQVANVQEWMLMRASSTLGNPDYTGTYLVAPAIVALSLAVAEPGGWKRWAAAGFAAVCGLTAFVTLTRAAWIGIIVGLIVYFLIARDRKRPAGRAILVAGGAIVGIVLLGVLVAGPSGVASRFSSLGGGLDGLSSGRITLWGDAARIIANQPLLGTGADRLALGAYEVQKNLFFQGPSRMVLQDPHNGVLMVAGIFGIPALLALGALLYLALSAALRWLGANPAASGTRSVYAGWVAALVAILVTSLFSVLTLPFVFSVFLVIGVVLSPTLRPIDGHRVVAIVGGVLALALIGVGLYGTSLAFASSRHLMLARYADTRSHLEESLRLTPWDTRLSTNYYFAKINANRAILTGDDITLAQETAAQIDAELRLALLETPRELLFHSLRIDLYAASKGYPAYQADAHLAAIDEALAAFPGDPEFTREARRAAVGWHAVTVGVPRGEYDEPRRTGLARVDG